MLKRCFVMSCLLLCAVGVVVAQTASTGALEGTVSDASGAVIPNATVTLTQRRYWPGSHQYNRSRWRLPFPAVEPRNLQPEVRGHRI